MHVKVSFKVAKKFAAVRKAVRRFQWVQANACFCGCDAEWVFSHWDAVNDARSAVR
jgi:hypothetical protein